MSSIDASTLLGAGADGYQIERSLRFDGSAYLNRTPASAGNRRTFTISYWIKRSALLPTSGGNPQYLFSAGSGTSESTWFQAGVFEIDSLHNETNLATWTTNALITPKFRDTSAWYHFVWSVDTTQASASNRVKAWVNGIEQPKSTPTISQNADLAWNNNVVHYIGARIDSGPRQFADCYLTEVYNIDGQALTPSSFGETDTITGVWKPKKYAGTYGTNGFYLKFADNSGTTSTTLGKDSSGNGNNWTPNNFSVTAGAGNDSMIDTPTPYADGGNGRGNYCTLNAVSPLASGTLSNGNLSFSTGNADAIAVGTVAVSSGKWYWEITATNVNASLAAIGIIGQPPASLTVDLRTPSNGYCYISNGNKGNNNTTAAYGVTYTSGDVIGVALDLDAGTLVFYKNNSSQGTAYSSLSGTFSPAISDLSGASGGAVFDCNFGQRPFAYTPPAGFLALNTQNLPEPSIKKPSSYMDTLLYTGNATARNITGLGFSPDLVWIKSRSALIDHKLYDAVRGTTKVLESSNTGAEGTDSGGLTAFNSDGFSLGTAAGQNQNGTTYVAWCWDESATPGFDIVTYTGNGGTQNISHNLGVSPSFIIVKNRSAVTNWIAWHSTFAATDYIALNLANAKNYAGSLSTLFTGVSSTTFSIGSDSSVNGSGSTHVAYCFSEVAGFSKFGSYTGNGSTDGPFVACNFRPRWIMIKTSSAGTNGWQIRDTVRDSYNTSLGRLYADLSSTEGTGSGNEFDILSNGFKVRNSGGDLNASGVTYIFAAFAETSAKYSLAR